MKKGTIFFFAKTFLLIFFIVFVILTCTLLIVISKFVRPKLFTHTVTVVYESVTAEDALVSLLEMRSNNVTFRKAIYYALIENVSDPMVYNGTDWVEINVTSLAKRYLKKVCIDKYNLFITNENGEFLKKIASNYNYYNFGGKSSRASIPLTGDRWLVLYLKNCLNDRTFALI